MSLINPLKDISSVTDDKFDSEQLTFRHVAMTLSLVDLILIAVCSIFSVRPLATALLLILQNGVGISGVFIHQRFKIFRNANNWYARGIRRAHKIHHKHLGKEDGECFGMLFVPFKYFKKQ